MGYQIVKQPNGLYCIFSTVVDSIVDYNLTRDRVVGFMTKKETKKIEDDVDRVIEG